MARVDADLLDTMLNNAGEVSIFRSRLDQQVNSIDFNLAELARTVTRLKEQLRGLEIETEAQVLNRHQDEGPAPQTISILSNSIATPRCNNSRGRSRKLPATWRASKGSWKR